MENVIHGGFIPENINPEILGGFSKDFKLLAEIEKESELDKKLHVIFEDGVRFMGYKTSLNGYPVFEQCETVRVIIESGKQEFFYQLEFKADCFGNVHPTEATRRIIAQFKSRYDAFKEKSKNRGKTPYNALGDVDIALVATLINLGIPTLEDLILVDTTALEKVPGASALQKKAKGYFSLNKDELLEAKNAEIDELRKKVIALESLNGKKPNTDSNGSSGSEQLEQTQGNSGESRPNRKKVSVADKSGA